MAEMSLVQLMRAATILQNPRVEIEESTTSANARSGLMSPLTGVRAPRSVQQSEGETPAVIAAQQAEENVR